MSDEECIHLNDPALCTICNGKDAAGKSRPRGTPKPVVKAPAAKAAKPAASPTKRVTRTVATESLDTPESVEEYRSRYPDDRQATFDAYVEVFFNTDARQFPGGWTQFTRCADADRERKETAPALVVRAEAMMRAGGYEADDTGRPLKARRWSAASA